MNTAWLDPMEEKEELNAFLLEEQAIIMNQQQQQLLPQTNDVPRPLPLLNTMATNTTAAATNTRAEDIISWLDKDDDDDVYIPSLSAAVTVDDDDDDVQEALQENLYNNLQMDHHHHHQIEEGILVLEDDDNNNNNNTNNHEDFMNDIFDQNPPGPIINNPNHHFPLPESPFLLDLLCNINEFDILRPSDHPHPAVEVEEIPPENNYHQSTLSCSSPPLLGQNIFFDDPDMSEFTLINEVDNHDPVISTTTTATTTQLVSTSTSCTTTTTLDDHINVDHNRSHEKVIDNVSIMINKVIITATDEVATLDQGDDGDEENNEHKEMDTDAGVDDDGENPNYKTMISTNASTSSLASASTSTSTSTSACKNLVSERNRRRRLSQQLLALRSLVPNITKMDKRSVLVDALAYLKSIHEETTRLQNELKQQLPPQSNTMMNSSTTTTITTALALGEEANLCIPRMLARSKPRAIIFTEIDTERIENQRFVVKITCKVKGGSNISSSSSSSNGVGGDVLRVMESLGFDISYTCTTTPHHHHQTTKPQNQQFLTTLFIRVRNNKHGKMTEEKLRECISTRALRYGITLQKHTSATIC